MTPGVAEFLLGINYFPRRKGIKLWQTFDRGEVRDELAQIASWGVDAVRVFLTWQDFQPGEMHINHRALDDLGTLLALAGDQHLRVLPTLFSGPLDGAFFFPDWCLDPQPLRPSVRIISNGREVRHGVLRPIFTDNRCCAPRNTCWTSWSAFLATIRPFGDGTWAPGLNNCRWISAARPGKNGSAKWASASGSSRRGECAPGAWDSAS